jgi:hypothetical protein
MADADRRLQALVENLAAQQRLARAIEAGLAVDAREVNRLVHERERLLSPGAGGQAGATRAGAG